MQTKRESDYFLTPIVWKWSLASETEFAPHKSLKFSEILHNWCLILSLKSVQVISLNSIQVQRIWANDNGNISLYWGPEHLQGWDSDALRSCTTLDCRGTALPRSSFLVHKTHMSAAAMLPEPLWVALEGFLWGAQKHFITCVYLCVYVYVCAHVFMGICRYLLACFLTCSEGEPQFVQNILPKKLDSNLEYIWTSKHSDENSGDEQDV